MCTRGRDQKRKSRNVGWDDRGHAVAIVMAISVRMQTSSIHSQALRQR